MPKPPRCRRLPLPPTPDWQASPPDFTRQMAGCEAVVHTAVIHPPEGDPDEIASLTLRVQLQGLFNIFEAIRQSATVQR